MKFSLRRSAMRRLSPSLAGLALLVALVGAWALSPGGVRQVLRERALDRLLPLLPHGAAGDRGVVIVDIDRASLARLGPWPWPRDRMAELVSAVAAGKPAALALDILFAGPDRLSANGDAALAQAVSAAPAVLGFVMDTANAGQDLPTTPILFRTAVALPGLWQADGVIGPVPLLVDAAQGLGALVAAADPDGPTRRVPLMVMAGKKLRPGLAVEAVRLALGVGTLLVDGGGTLVIGGSALPLGSDAMLRLWRSPDIPTISAATLLAQPEASAALAGRVALIGSSAPEAGGMRVTPASPATPSVRLQAEAIEAILHGHVPARRTWSGSAEVAGAATLGLLCLVLAARLRPAVASLLAIVACLGWIGATVAAVPALSALLDPAGPPTLAIVTFILATLIRFVRDEWRARLLRLSFEQHLAPEVVRRIAADPAALRLQGEMREITALFTDIEDFTGMTERAEPVDLIALLDAYFDVATRVITDHGGMIDKIVGDAIHAIFNAPFTLEDHPRRAVASALALLAATEEVRHSPLGQRLGLGRTRVGIETGPAIVGDVGGSRKLDYTAHGNAINAAARLEAVNKELGSAICIGPGTAACLEPRTVRRIGTITPRGQSAAMDVYTPVSLLS
ncbi:MAG TPA: adenylate/guanylate cyclase domain-containing protein [Acetobacteraceae bacterium]|nr:adenylate/guanylate cyclase domain-containing protein [Acetobacteraceae bacterium]